MLTYNDVYLSARRQLRAAGIAAHDLEARLIVAHASGKTREELISSIRLFIDDSLKHAVDGMIERRLRGEPIAYITGQWEFYGIPVIVSNAVLIPRVDTELLAQEAIKLIKSRNGQTRMLDLCTGSGCIGLAVAANAPDCRVVLADDSTQALAVCRANMLKNHITRNVTAIVADALSPPPAMLGTFDVIACNPPYIKTSDIKNLDPSVREYEPIHALDGGPDGLMFFKAITKNFPVLLRQGGHLAMECGAGQSRSLREIMAENGFSDIRTLIDTLGIERVVAGTYGGHPLKQEE